MKRPLAVLTLAVAASALAGCSSLGVGISVPIGGPFGVGVGVGSGGRIGGSVGAGVGGIGVGVGGSTQLARPPQLTASQPEPPRRSP